MKLLLKILMIPIVIIHAIIVLVALCMFPLPLILLITFFSLILQPFVWSFTIAGVEDVENPFEPFGFISISDKYSYLSNTILTLTVPIWFIPFSVYYYFRYNKLLNIS
jgi:hypothetical protein